MSSRGMRRSYRRKSRAPARGEREGIEVSSGSERDFFFVAEAGGYKLQVQHVSVGEGKAPGRQIPASFEGGNMRFF